MDWVRSDFSISMLGKLCWFRLTGLITGSIDLKMDGSVLEEKSPLKMLSLTFSSKLDWGSYIISIEALIRSIKFLSPEVALYLYKSTIHSCIEYCCHVWDSEHAGLLALH